MDFLHQQADRGDLNVTYLSKYILNTMVLLCAPVRDEAVQRLENIADPVRLLRCDVSPSLLQVPSREGSQTVGQPLTVFCWRQLGTLLPERHAVDRIPRCEEHPVPFTHLSKARQRISRCMAVWRLGSALSKLKLKSTSAPRLSVE